MAEIGGTVLEWHLNGVPIWFFFCLKVHIYAEFRIKCVYLSEKTRSSWHTITEIHS